MGDNKMKHSVKLFLEVLKEATLQDQEKPSKEFKRGVNETIEMAEAWFESNGVTEFDINPKE